MADATNCSVITNFDGTTFTLVRNEKYSNVVSNRTFSLFLTLYIERVRQKKRLVFRAKKARSVTSNQKELKSSLKV